MMLPNSKSDIAYLMRPFTALEWRVAQRWFAATTFGRIIILRQRHRGCFYLIKGGKP